MKKRWFISLMAVVLCFSMCLAVSADTSDVLSERISELADDPAYDYPTIRALHIEQDTQTGQITFQNADPIAGTDQPDTNTYLIDQDTHIDENYIELGAINMEKFLSGEHPWISVFVLKEEMEKGNQLVHVAAVIGTVERNVVIPNVGEDSFERLERYDIMTRDENGSFRPMDNTTRAEMAKILADTYNMPKITYPPSFHDVPESHWAYPYIGTVESMGIMCGHGDGIFAPEEALTNEQAVKTIVCLLGYQPKAEEAGGYPAGYLAVAEEIGLTDGLQLEADAGAQRKDVAMLIDKALDTPIMIQTVYGPTPEYVICDGEEAPLETLLSMCFKE